MGKIEWLLPYLEKIPLQLELRTRDDGIQGIQAQVKFKAIRSLDKEQETNV